VTAVISWFIFLKYFINEIRTECVSCKLLKFSPKFLDFKMTYNIKSCLILCHLHLNVENYKFQIIYELV
jgi:hypothetical protein